MDRERLKANLHLLLLSVLSSGAAQGVWRPAAGRAAAGLGWSA